MEPAAIGAAVALTKPLGRGIRSVYAKVTKDVPDEAKRCRVCDKRIHKNLKFATTRRFYCKKCGHRTHVGCAYGKVSDHTCDACNDQPVNVIRAKLSAKSTRVFVPCSVCRVDIDPANAYFSASTGLLVCDSCFARNEG